MPENSILEYINRIMSKIDLPDNQKIQIENELIRYVIKSVENASVNEVKNNLSFPEKVAAEISNKLALNNYQTPEKESYHHVKKHQACTGNFMQELSHMNLKLLFIPLIQITSGTSRLIMPLTEDDDY
jgi:uncharacterized membrane protein